MNLPTISLPNIPGIPGLPKLPDLPGMPSLPLGGFGNVAQTPPLADTMMCLGDFVFELRSAPYQTINEDWAWRHPESARVGAPPASQFAGKETDKLKLSGELYPGLTGGMVTLGALRDMAEAGDSYTLIDGLFNNLGEFVIEKISVTRTDFLPNGVARRVEFNLELKRVEDIADEDAAATADADALDAADMAGDALDAAKDAADSLASAVSGGLSGLLPGSLPDLAGASGVLGGLAGDALGGLADTVASGLPSITTVAACAAGAKAAVGAAVSEVKAAVTGAIAATTGLPAATVSAVISASSTAEALTAAAGEAAKAAVKGVQW